MDGTRLLRAATPNLPTFEGSDDGVDYTGRVLDGRFQIGARLGIGGMGVVYRARHVAIGREVAVKILRGRYSKDPDLSRRFLLEAQAVSSIKHPNVVEILDFAQTAGEMAYFVMELLEGRTLADELDECRRLPPERAMAIAAQIAAGLAAAHAAGIVHRDLKPDNVFLGRSRSGSAVVKLLDFGVARVLNRRTRLTAAGTVIGTPEYMSPEQAQSDAVDGRSDLYSLGAMLFEMLTGRPPFRGKTVAETLSKHLFEPPPSTGCPNQQLEAFVQDLLAKAAAGRPQTAELVVNRLRVLRSDSAAEVVSKRTMALGSNSFDRQPSAAASPPLGAGVLERGEAPDWSPALPLRDRLQLRTQTGTAPTPENSPITHPVTPPILRTRRLGRTAVWWGATVAWAFVAIGVVGWMNARAHVPSNKAVDGPTVEIGGRLPTKRRPAPEQDVEPTAAPSHPEPSRVADARPDGMVEDKGLHPAGSRWESQDETGSPDRSPRHTTAHPAPPSRTGSEAGTKREGTRRSSKKGGKPSKKADQTPDPGSSKADLMDPFAPN